MPTYVYRCKKGHEFELFHGISDDTPKRCPKCRSGAQRVPAGGSGLLFKGSGFYITDYRSSGYKDSVKNEKGSKSDTPPAPGGGSGGSPGPASGGDSGGSSGASPGGSAGKSGE